MCNFDNPERWSCHWERQYRLILSLFFLLTQSYYFDRDDVALPGFAKYFKKAADEEKEHAEKLMKFQNQRGGRVILKPISKPAKDEWGSGLDAMQAALELEKAVNQALLDLHKVADSHNDYQVLIDWCKFNIVVIYSNRSRDVN